MSASSRFPRAACTYSAAPTRWAPLAAGCASAPKTPALLAVVPGADGPVGAVVGRTGREERVIDSAYGAQRLRRDGSVEAAQLTAADIRREFGSTLDALPGKPATFTLYFLEGRDELTPESKGEMDKVFGELKRRQLPDIVVIGHTDTVGGLAFNDRLSLARAERLREMMIA